MSVERVREGEGRDSICHVATPVCFLHICLRHDLACLSGCRRMMKHGKSTGEHLRCAGIFSASWSRPAY
jgi:hypothetical protein